MDILAVFISECCEEVLNFWDYSKDLYETYKRWCEDKGERIENKRRFEERLRERGFERAKDGAHGAAAQEGHAY